MLNYNYYYINYVQTMFSFGDGCDYYIYLCDVILSIVIYKKTMLYSVGSHISNTIWDYLTTQHHLMYAVIQVFRLLDASWLL